MRAEPITVTLDVHVGGVKVGTIEVPVTLVAGAPPAPEKCRDLSLLNWGAALTERQEPTEGGQS